MKRFMLFFLATFVSASAIAQRQQPSPGVGNAVLLAMNSIRIDRGSVIVSGDVIVNAAPSAPLLGTQSLSLDRSVTTPASYKLAATSIGLDQGDVAGGDVYFNSLVNNGTIAGARITPLALPVFATLPAVLDRLSGTTDVIVADGTTRALDAGAYGNLTIGRGATLRLTGGNYAFASISVGRNGTLRYAAPADVVVNGHAEFGSGSIIAPNDGSGLSAAALRIQMSDGHVGQGSNVAATLYATAGLLALDQSFAGTGAFLGRDIHVGASSRLTIDSAFNVPPAANAQTVFTSGTTPLVIRLTGSDPDGSPLTFGIVAPPAAGTLSAPVAASPSSANVTYTPASANAPDSFTFRVSDPGGATGVAVVTINPLLSDPPPPEPTTVSATDSAAQTAKDIAATLLLRGTAPNGIALTFSIVPNSGPSHGTLGAVVQGTETPQRSAIVTYTPDAGYVGPDAFRFQACGATVCDDALFALTVQEGLIDPPAIAHDIEVSTPADEAILISLGDTAITTRRVFTLAPHAALLHPVTVAGNVADANVDGIGDNVNALPGSAPVFMSAGVHESGGDGSNGTTRMQFEWDMTPVTASADALVSAVVVLPTHRGTVDSLDTSFYWVGASGDGQLTASDFQSPAEVIPGAVMPVPQSMPVGGEGTFTFSVLDQVRAAAQGNFAFFAIQGRVDESVNTAGRGLEVRTSASGNIATSAVPMLSLATPGITAPLQYRILSLPNNGQLLDSLGRPITKVPFDLTNAQVQYTPNQSFVGVDTFAFDVSNGTTLNAAIVTVRVLLGQCRFDVRFCDNGR